MRAFVDANVFISAAGFGGIPDEIVEMVLDGRLEAVVSHQALADIEEKLHTKAGLSRTEAREFRLTVEAIATVVEVADIPQVSRDPDDDEVLAVAIQADADAIVTGDKDLLVLRSHHGIPIVSPRAFFEMLEQEGQ